VAAATPRVDASDWWCWDDPVLVIDNQVVQILAGVPEAARTRVRLAEVTVIVPAGVNARITASISPRFPLTSRLIQSGPRGADGAVTVTAVLKVNAQGEFPTAIRLRQASGVEQTGYGMASGTATASMQIAGKPIISQQFGRDK
jgi:hypothetical protein